MFGKEKELTPEKPARLRLVESQMFGSMNLVEIFILEDTATGDCYMVSSKGGIVPME